MSKHYKLENDVRTRIYKYVDNNTSLTNIRITLYIYIYINRTIGRPMWEVDKVRINYVYLPKGPIITIAIWAGLGKPVRSYLFISRVFPLPPLVAEITRKSTKTKPMYRFFAVGFYFFFAGRFQTIKIPPPAGNSVWKNCEAKWKKWYNILRYR